ncbi:hypothetical protein FGO68_gene17487 [Halteria grandinella]|uniref:Uncharacterized protein n=1 Tax=Halteria grandinella TaxID=5974 RepID=A0A8J8SYX8_HALGN|nr:hypothetical protein FGO68_gene17487 [Halteria grandinella]
MFYDASFMKAMTESLRGKILKGLREFWDIFKYRHSPRCQQTQDSLKESTHRLEQMMSLQSNLSSFTCECNVPMS